MRRFLPRVAIVAALVICPAAFCAAPPDWEHDAQIDAPEGHAQLIWTTDAPLGSDSFEVQIRLPEREFKTVYSGSDRATTLSGLPRGETEARVRITDPEASDWTPVATVTTGYPSRQQTITWMVVGLLLFLATVGYIAIQSRKHGAAQ